MIKKQISLAAGCALLIACGYGVAAVAAAGTPQGSAVTTTLDAGGAPVLLGPRTKTTGCTLGPLPDRRCSPGAYATKLTQAVVCAPGFTTPPYRHVPDSEKRLVEQEYGMNTTTTYGKTLEIDHIVSLELGGSNNIANLFPEKRDVAPGYKVKDALETHLNTLVCTKHTMTLKAAQIAIATNWETLYKKVYGHTP
jgi:hypothetical protein